MGINRLFDFIKNSYRLDLRSLALMRIGLALIIMTDLVIRSTDLQAFYTDDGIWPTSLSYQIGWKPGYWSFHTLSGWVAFQVTLFILHFLLGFLLLFGVRTRITTLLLFVFTVSLHNRNLFILQGGDDLLRMTLLWGILLPWGARFSMDSKRTSNTTNQPFLASVGYLFFVSSVYCFSALLKSSPDWLQDSSAAYYALSLEQLRLPLGTWIYYHPTLLTFATKAVYFFELLIPLLILSPWKVTRSFAFIFIVGFHLAIGLTLYVGLFFIIGCVTAIGLIPTTLIDRFLILIKRQDNVLPTYIQRENPLLNGLCFIVLGLSLMINLSSLPNFSYELRNELRMPAQSLRLDQYWGMFSPGVLRMDGWLVYHGRDSIGAQWDLRLNQDYVDYKKPARIVSMYKNDRWRKLAENLQMDKFSFLRPLYCRYVLKKWNQNHRKKMLTLSLYFMEKENLPGYKTSVPTPKLLCFCNED